MTQCQSGTFDGAGSAPRTHTENETAAASSVALANMRAFVILAVLAFHSALAYLGSLGPAAFVFDDPPFKWRAFPIVDAHRWYGFDIFCAWQDVFLMSLMFFLSALFVQQSLLRKGAGKFLIDRILRLGVPFVFAVVVIMPVALYPVYRTTATDPGLTAYWQHLLALPFWPNGPMWFLWQLLALSAIAAAVHRLAPNWITGLGRRSCTSPGRYFLFLATASAIAYVPLALIFTPWAWSDHGPLAIQLSRPLHYAVFYFAGLGVGAFGLGRGLLAPDGRLATAWAQWLGAAVACLMLWMGLTGLSMAYSPAPWSLQIASGLAFVLACTTGCLAAIAMCLRLCTRPSRILDSIARKSFGLYLFHYIFIVWLQCSLLDLPLPAIAKAAIVFGGTLALAWALTAALRFVPFGWMPLGEPPSARASLPIPASFAGATKRLG